MKNRFEINDRFWSDYQSMVSRVMLPYQYAVLNDSLDDPDIEKSHSIENFRIAAGEAEGTFYGCPFQDSDTAKWLEAVAYSLMLTPDPELEAQADEVIALVGRAQEKDGYLNTYFTVQKPDAKWQNLMEGHELYCAGHMIEAGVAYYEATGKTALLDIVCKLADLMVSIFGEGRTVGIPGHPEVELALVRLYRATGKEEYLTLAKFFVDTRGTDKDHFVKEAAKRDWHIWDHLDPANVDYLQNRLPVREETDAIGHSVRAVYLYTGMAIVARETGDESLIQACERMWESIVRRRMYITGGISSDPHFEAFSMDYDLPNDTVYAETCASVGLVFFAKEMLGLRHEARYADVMELALYNTVLSGVQRDGKRFFYSNPLDVDPMYARKLRRMSHISAQRPKWYACACCPPNSAHLITSVNRYAWHEADGAIYSDLFISGEFAAEQGAVIETKTEYPYSGKVSYAVKQAEKPFALKLRNPSWSKNTLVEVNGEAVSCACENGYLTLPVVHAGDEIILMVNIAPRRMYGNPKVAADQGKVAFMAGPLVYCFEDQDNGNLNCFLAADRGEMKAEGLVDEKLGSVNVLQVPGWKIEETDELYVDHAPEQTEQTMIAVPYYAWGNRTIGKMKVWMPRK